MPEKLIMWLDKRFSFVNTSANGHTASICVVWWQLQHFLTDLFVGFSLQPCKGRREVELLTV